MDKIIQNLQFSINNKLFVKDPETSSLGKKILQNSITLIDEIGFEAFTFKKLGEQIGSNESSIYRYFENKHKLLIYLSTWYWSWVEYQLVFSTMGIKNSEEKLNEALKIITKKVENDKNTTYINEAVLHRIITAEYTKTFLTKDVDVENKEGYFVVYKRIILRLIEMIEAVNPNYSYSKSLASSVVEGILHQRYLKEHFTSITNLTENDCLFEFYSDLVKKALQ